MKYDDVFEMLIIFERFFFVGSAAISLAIFVAIVCVIADCYGLKINKKGSIIELLKIMFIVAIYQLIYNGICEIAPGIIKTMMLFGYIILFMALISKGETTRKHKTE